MLAAEERAALPHCVIQYQVVSSEIRCIKVTLYELMKMYTFRNIYVYMHIYGYICVSLFWSFLKKNIGVYRLV